MTEPGLTGRQGVRSAFCGIESVSPYATSASGARIPSRGTNGRRPGMTRGGRVSACADNTEIPAAGWRRHGERWERRTPGDWTKRV